MSTHATIGRLAPPIESFGGEIIRVLKARVDGNPWGKPLGEEPVTFIQVEISDGRILRARMCDEYPEARVLSPDVSTALARCLWSHHFLVDEETVLQYLQEEGYVSL